MPAISPQAKAHQKEYNKRWALANLDKIRARQRRYMERHPGRAKEHYLARRDRNLLFVWKYKLEHPCIDCGESDPVVLEFDHRDPSEKKHDVAQMAKWAKMARLMEEIGKCDMRCANCHRRRHFKERNPDGCSYLQQFTGGAKYIAEINAGK